MHLLVYFMMILSLGFSLENDTFFEKLPSLLQEENWEDVVLSGERVLLNDISNEERFTVLDQLLSIYFRLGLFEKAKEKANKLVDLGTLLKQPVAIVDSFYKLSAALR